jgi:hypothetical protein
MDGALYELAGDRWVIPIIALEIQPALYQVQLADIPLLKRQREVAAEILTHHAQSREKDCWYINKAAFAKIAIPAHTADPEDIVLWNVEHAYDISVNHFQEAYCRSRYAPPVLKVPENFAVVWDGLCKFMLDYILRGGEVDFGFAKLEAFCCRANWKNWLMARLNSNTRRSKQVSPKHIEAVVARMITLLGKSAITSLDRTHNVVRWWPEFTPTANFHDRSRQLEILRKQKVKTGHRYMTDIYRLVTNRQYRRRLYEHFRTYARETAYPNTVLSNSYVSRDAAPPKDEPPLPVLPPAGWPATPVVLGINRNEEKRRPVVPEDAFLPKVQDIQSLRQDVWNPRRPMVASGEQAPEAGGLSLLFTAKERNGRELLAVRPDGGDSRLASRIEFLPPDDGGPLE